MLFLMGDGGVSEDKDEVEAVGSGLKRPEGVRRLMIDYSHSLGISHGNLLIPQQVGVNIVFVELVLV